MNRRIQIFITLGIILTASAAPTLTLGGLFKKNKEKQVLSGEQLASQESKAAAMLQKAQSSEQAGKKRQARDLYRSIVKSYPRTDSAAEALFRSAQIRESEGDPKRAFEEYQDLMSGYRNSQHFNQALDRQFAIAENLRKTEKKKLFGLGAVVQPSKLIEMFEQISKSAPHTEYAPNSLVSVGHIYSKQGSTIEALAAYQKVVDAYPNTKFSTEAQYEIFRLRGVKADHSNSPVEDRAQVEAGLDFMSQNPNDARTQQVKEGLDNIEERAAEKNFKTGLGYEKQGKYVAARVYYRDLVKSPGSKWAAKARERLAIMDRAESASANSVENRSKFLGSFPGRKKKVEMRTPGDEVVPLPNHEGSSHSH